MKKNVSKALLVLGIFSVSITGVSCDPGNDNPNNTTTTTTRSGEDHRNDNNTSTTGTSGSTGNQSNEEYNGSANDAGETRTISPHTTSGSQD
jgi:hypothetical protein